jgi:tetratricopeptide (TPR) repeat protein
MAYDEISLYAKAISDGTKAIELAPELPFAYIVRGYAYSKGAAKHEMAIKDITRAIELEPSWDVFYLFRGEAYQRKDDHKSALIDFKKATTVNPSNPENYYILGRAWLQNEVRDKDKAILYITKGIKKDSDKKRADYYRNHLIVIETLYSK